MTVEELSGFTLQSILRAKEVVDIVATKTEEHQAALLDQDGIKTVRIALNHAQMMALAEALQLVVPITDNQLHELHEHFRLMAKQREQALSADHPLVQEFWDMYEYLNQGEGEDLNQRLNHSRVKGQVAINLNHFVTVAADHKQQIPPVRELKQLLKTSRRYKYEGQRVVNSAIKTTGSTSERCWIFSVGGADRG